jgi:sec-independent protein translocase protein TatB
VLGPERLPKAARFAGLWVRRARAQWHSVKSELERDLAAEDLRRSLQDTQAAMREAQAALREAGGDARRGLETLRGDLMQGTSPPPAAAAPDATETGAADAPPEDDDRAR